MENKKRKLKQTSAQEQLVRRDIVFPFGPTTLERRNALNTLYAELSQHIYCTRSQFIVSEDKTYTKFVLWCTVSQENFLDSYMRRVPDVKWLNEDDPVEQMTSLIEQYHRKLWNQLDFPHEEMHLSALICGIGFRKVALDYPTFREQTTLWDLGGQCYQAIEKTGLFTELLSCPKMVVYSFICGYLGGQGTWEGETMEANGKMKAQLLVMEERGEIFTYIHAHMEHMRNKFTALGYRNAMEFMNSIARKKEN